MLDCFFRTNKYFFRLDSPFAPLFGGDKRLPPRQFSKTSVHVFRERSHPRISRRPVRRCDSSTSVRRPPSTWRDVLLLFVCLFVFFGGRLFDHLSFYFSFSLRAINGQWPLNRTCSFIKNVLRHLASGCVSPQLHTSRRSHKKTIILLRTVCSFSVRSLNLVFGRS